MSSGIIDYPFEDFAHHFEWDRIRTLTHVTRRTGSTIELGDDRSYEANVMRVDHYFRQHYSPDMAMELGSLFGVIMSFLSRHMPEFDVGTLAVQGRIQSSSLKSCFAQFIMRSSRWHPKTGTVMGQLLNE